MHDNAKSPIPVSQIAKPRFKTPTWSDNECAGGLANTTGATKRLKHADRRFNWIQDQVVRRSAVEEKQQQLVSFFEKSPKS